LVPPEVTWPPPLDCTGALAGARRLLELPEELDEFAEVEEPEELEVLPVLAPEPGRAEPPLDAPVPDDDAPVLFPAGELELPVVLCAEPGSAAATAPAASTLATPTVAVAVFSLRRPRSRSATARETCRAARWPRGTPLRSSQLSIIAV
jgi:hypothetical protein